MDYSDPPEKPLSMISDPSDLGDATPSVKEATRKGKKLMHKMLNMRRLFNVQLEGRMLSTMKKDQLNFMKTTGFQSKVHENASEELYGTKTILGKSSLKRRVPQKDGIYIPESFEIKSSITTPASPRLSKQSTRSGRGYQTHRQSSPISSSSLSSSLRS